jgi:perosamine synthetase
MPIFSPQPRFRMYTKLNDYVRALSVLAAGSYTEGEDCELLEQQISTLMQIDHAVCMPQARVGLYLAIRAAVEPDREVILSPNTIADVINMVICAGAIPVFCDIDPITGNIDPDLVEPLITQRTAAILVTHLYGLVAPMEQLKRIALTHNLVLIEDAAQAFGARFNGQWAGTLGDIGIFSFGMAKNITSFFGGMLVTSNSRIAKSIRRNLSEFPMIDKGKLRKKVLSCLVKEIFTTNLFFPHILFKIFRAGYQKDIKAITRLIETELDLSLKNDFPDIYKEQMSPLQARLVLSKLNRLDVDCRHRLQCARMYYKGLKDIDALRLPPMIEDGSHVYNYYTIGYKDRAGLRLFMMENNRDAALQHIKNTADLPAFKAYYRDCPHCRKWANESIMLPNYGRYSLDEVARNITVIRSYFNK